jgi:spermidine/putrescine-binding protein
MKKRHSGNGGRRSSLPLATRLFGLLALLALAGVLVAACGGGGSDTGSAADTESETAASGEEGSASGETLNVLTWEGYDEPEWLKEFEGETGIKVNATNVGSPAEMFSKVKASPGQFDIVLATAGWFPQYVDSDLLEPIDEAKVTALKDLKLGFDWEEATTVDGTMYGVLYNWGDQPLAWVPEGIKGLDLSKYENSKGELDDWNVLWDPALKGKITVFDDPTSVEPMVPLALGFKNPYQLDEQEFEAFEKKLFELGPQVNRLTTGFDDQTAALASGEADVAYLNIISIAATLKKEGKDLIVNHLVENGVPAWTDNLSITKEGGGNKLDAVYDFINFTLSLPWQARFIAETSNSGTLNYEQATSPEAKKIGLTPEKLEETMIPATRAGDPFFENMKFFQEVDDLEKRLQVWNEFKLGLGG